MNAPLAQSVEQWTVNPCVAGSSPAGGALRAAVFGCFFYVCGWMLLFIWLPVQAFPFFEARIFCTVKMNAAKQSAPAAAPVVSAIQSKKEHERPGVKLW